MKFIGLSALCIVLFFTVSIGFAQDEIGLTDKIEESKEELLLKKQIQIIKQVTESNSHLTKQI